ncbi:MAG: GspE/PulE family protein [Candidatus Pacebacteria bacterium]|nr:GspE/PulE family protein [Candidatus Paceibacterota bacterium]
MSLIKQLAEKGLIDQEKAKVLEEEAKKGKEEEVILNSGAVPEEVLFKIKSENLSIPLKEVDVEKVTLKALELIPEETAKFYQMIPLEKTEKTLEVGMVYPEDLKAQEVLKFWARQKNFNYTVFLITPDTLKKLLSQYRTLKEEVGQALEELEGELKEEKIKGRTEEDYEKIAEDAPITKIVAVILRHAVEGSASDIHIEPTRTKLRIRFRFLGELHSSIFLPIKIHSAVVARIKILSNLKIDETRIPQDGRFSTNVAGKIIDYRVSTFPTSLGEKVAIRVLDPEASIKTFEDLGLRGRNLEIVKEKIKKPYGLILVTGPTGSGKTTTLYAVLKLLNKDESNIVTLEDPVEYLIDGINQSQVRPEIEYTFASGLRHILRQDPNVIMVGEIRDEETATLAIHAALTGHIVLSTLHTNNALGVVPRLIDMGIKPYLLPPTLQVAIAQRLVRKLCKECRKKVKPTAEVKELILKKIANMPDSYKSEAKLGGKTQKEIYVYEPVGCSKCAQTGFSGRIALFEVFSSSPAIIQEISKDLSEANLLKKAREEGMMTIDQDGILKALEGLTTIEEVLRVTEER